MYCCLGDLCPEDYQMSPDWDVLDQLLPNIPKAPSGQLDALSLKVQTAYRNKLRQNRDITQEL